MSTNPVTQNKPTSPYRQLGFIVLLLLVLGLVGYFLYRLLKDTDVAKGSDTVAQVLWLTLSLVLMLIVLLAIAVILRLVNPDSPTTALGLPEGSISAVIALTLLILFSLSSVYVFATINSAENDSVTSTGLSIADVHSLPNDRVLQVTKESGSKPATYSVQMTKPHTTSIEIGRTTLATISTLLVAIVGFYFGQRASEKGIETGIQSAKTAAPLEPGTGAAGVRPAPPAHA
jgi:hypothetical protein